MVSRSISKVFLDISKLYWFDFQLIACVVIKRFEVLVSTLPYDLVSVAVWNFVLSS